MSGNRPEVVHQVDDFRTVSGHCHFRGPEVVRSGLSMWTTSGPGKARKISGSGDHKPVTNMCHIGAEQTASAPNDARL